MPSVVGPIIQNGSFDFIVDGVNVGSTGVTSGWVLEADGSDGVTWAAPSGGGGDAYNTITGDSGTASASGSETFNIEGGDGIDTVVAAGSPDKVTISAADMAQSRIKGRASGAGTGVPTDLTPDQTTAIINEGTTALKHEVGGLEVDVSAFSGIPIIDSGATTQATAGKILDIIGMTPVRPFSVHIDDALGNVNGAYHNAGGSNVENIGGMGIIGAITTQTTVEIAFKVPPNIPATLTPKLLLTGVCAPTSSQNMQFNMSYRSCSAAEAYDGTLVASSDNTLTVSIGSTDDEEFIEGKLDFEDGVGGGTADVVAGDYLVCILTILTASTLDVDSVWNLWLVWE